VFRSLLAFLIPRRNVNGAVKNKNNKHRVFFPIISYNKSPFCGSFYMSTKHILLVDDEEMVLELTETMLEALDYDVTAFLDVRDAIKRFSENQDQFDLIITDQSMPIMSGVDFAVKIRGIAPAMPVVIATGYTKDEILDQLDSLNARYVLEKPFTLDTMGTLIEQACSS